MGKKKQAEEPVKIRIRLPLEADVASTLIKVIGRTYPRTMIGTPESNLWQDKEMVLLIDQRDRHKSAKSMKRYQEDRDYALANVGRLTELSPSNVAIAPEEALAEQWAVMAMEMFKAHPDATNYLEMTVFHKETRETFVFWCARSERQTPHALRQAAETRADAAETKVAELEVQLAEMQAKLDRAQGPGALDTSESVPDRVFNDDRGRRWEWCGGETGTWAWRITGYAEDQPPRQCCRSVFGGPHVPGCDFEPREDNPIDYGGPAVVLNKEDPSA